MASCEHPVVQALEERGRVDTLYGLGFRVLVSRVEALLSNARLLVYAHRLKSATFQDRPGCALYV